MLKLTPEEQYGELLAELQVSIDEDMFGLVLHAVESNGLNLRKDAFVFLLVNLEWMLWRPYVRGEIVEEDVFGELLISVLAGAEADEQGLVSSHEIMKLAERNWDSLSEAFNWG